MPLEVTVYSFKFNFVAQSFIPLQRSYLERRWGGGGGVLIFKCLKFNYHGDDHMFL